MKETATLRVKTGLAEMLKGGVIMDVVTPEQAKVAEAAGAVSVMALERVPADIRKDGGVARMSDPSMIEGIQAAVSIPVMAKVRIGQTTSERLDYQPLAIFVRELVRPVYACRSCEAAARDPQIVKAALPPEPLPKSSIGAGLLAHVIVAKFCDHLPLHRQESILARHGWDVRRSTLCDHLQKCGRLLKPLYDLMHRRLLQSFAIHADDTPLLLLRPRRTAYAWVYLGDAQNPYTLFDLTAGGSKRGYTLEVRVSNATAIALYERFGFEPSGIRRGYYTDNREDALIMWKDPITQVAAREA